MPESRRSGPHDQHFSSDHAHRTIPNDLHDRSIRRRSALSALTAEHSQTNSHRVFATSAGSRFDKDDDQMSEWTPIVAPCRDNRGELLLPDAYDERSRCGAVKLGRRMRVRRSLVMTTGLAVRTGKSHRLHGSGRICLTLTALAVIFPFKFYRLRSLRRIFVDVTVASGSRVLC